MFQTLAAPLALVILIVGLSFVAWYYKSRAAKAESRAAVAKRQAQETLSTYVGREGSARATIKGQLAE